MNLLSLAGSPPLPGWLRRVLASHAPPPPLPLVLLETPDPEPADEGLLARRLFIEHADRYVAELDAEGCLPLDIRITVMRQTVIVEAQRRSTRLRSGNVVHVARRAELSRRRQLALPQPIALEDHEAVLENGTLTLTLRKETKAPLWAKPLPVQSRSRG